MADSAEQQKYSDDIKFFADFLNSQQAEQYQDALSEMLADGNVDGAMRLEVNMRDLELQRSGVTAEILQRPAECLPAFEDGIQHFCNTNAKFMKQAQIGKPVRLAITGEFGANHVTPRGLNCDLVMQMVMVEGVVTNVTPSKPRLIQSVYHSEMADRTITLQHADNVSLKTAIQQTNGTGIKEDKDGNDDYRQEFGHCVYKDQQKIIIQEAPENAPTGRIPQGVEVFVEQDMVDKCKPGDRVRVVGVYKAFPKINNGMTSGIFPMRIIANNLTQLKSQSIMPALHQDDTRNIKALSKQADFFDILTRSFAPSISGNDDVKRGLLLLMVGGAEKNFDNGTHLRGDLNMLMVGDPSCGKSQILRFVMNMSELAISTTGRGSSGVGLTAAVKVENRGPPLISTGGRARILHFFLYF